MDMYQKRKIRAEKKMKSEDEKGFSKMSINCDVEINGNHPESAEK